MRMKTESLLMTHCEFLQTLDTGRDTKEEELTTR